MSIKSASYAINGFSMLKMAIFADSVVDLLKNRLDALNRKEVIVEVGEFIDDIEAGTRIIKSGKLENRAMESVQAYEISMDLFSPFDEEGFGEIDKMKKELEYVNTVERVDSSKVTDLLSYFVKLRSKALISIERPILE